MTLMYAYNAGIIDEELLLLFDLNTLSNLEHELSLVFIGLHVDECKTEFCRVLSRGINDSANVLEIHDKVTVYNGCKVYENKAFCIV